MVADVLKDLFENYRPLQKVPYEIHFAIQEADEMVAYLAEKEDHVAFANDSDLALIGKCEYVEIGSTAPHRRFRICSAEAAISNLQLDGYEQLFRMCMATRGDYMRVGTDANGRSRQLIAIADLSNENQVDRFRSFGTNDFKIDGEIERRGAIYRSRPFAFHENNVSAFVDGTRHLKLKNHDFRDILSEESSGDLIGVEEGLQRCLPVDTPKEVVHFYRKQNPTLRAVSTTQLFSAARWTQFQEALDKDITDVNLLADRDSIVHSRYHQQLACGALYVFQGQVLEVPEMVSFNRDYIQSGLHRCLPLDIWQKCDDDEMDEDEEEPDHEAPHLDRQREIAEDAQFLLTAEADVQNFFLKAINERTHPSFVIADCRRMIGHHGGLSNITSIDVLELLSTQSLESKNRHRGICSLFFELLSSCPQSLSESVRSLPTYDIKSKWSSRTLYAYVLQVAIKCFSSAYNLGEFGDKLGRLICQKGTNISAEIIESWLQDYVHGSERIFIKHRRLDEQSMIVFTRNAVSIIRQRRGGAAPIPALQEGVQLLYQAAGQDASAAVLDMCKISTEKISMKLRLNNAQVYPVIARFKHNIDTLKCTLAILLEYIRPEGVAAHEIWNGMTCLSSLQQDRLVQVAKDFKEPVKLDTTILGWTGISDFQRCHRVLFLSLLVQILKEVIPTFHEWETICKEANLQDKDELYLQEWCRLRSVSFDTLCRCKGGSSCTTKNMLGYMQFFDQNVSLFSLCKETRPLHAGEIKAMLLTRQTNIGRANDPKELQKRSAEFMELLKLLLEAYPSLFDFTPESLVKEWSYGLVLTSRIWISLFEKEYQAANEETQLLLQSIDQELNSFTSTDDRTAYRKGVMLMYFSESQELGPSRSFQIPDSILKGQTKITTGHLMELKDDGYRRIANENPSFKSIFHAAHPVMKQVVELIARVQGHEIEVTNTSRDAGVKRKGTGRAKAGSSRDTARKAFGKTLLPARRSTAEDLAILSKDESVVKGKRSAASPPPPAEPTATRSRIHQSPSPPPLSIIDKNDESRIQHPGTKLMQQNPQAALLQSTEEQRSETPASTFVIHQYHQIV